MKHFKMIREILSAFAKGLEKNEVELAAEDLGISDIYFSNLCEMLEEQGLVRGVRIGGIDHSKTKIANLKSARITLAGLEYLCSNKYMQE